MTDKWKRDEKDLRDRWKRAERELRERVRKSCEIDERELRFEN